MWCTMSCQFEIFWSRRTLQFPQQEWFWIPLWSCWITTGKFASRLVNLRHAGVIDIHIDSWRYINHLKCMKWNSYGSAFTTFTALLWKANFMSKYCIVPSQLLSQSKSYKSPRCHIDVMRSLQWPAGLFTQYWAATWIALLYNVE